MLATGFSASEVGRLNAGDADALPRSAPQRAVTVVDVHDLADEGRDGVDRHARIITQPPGKRRYFSGRDRLYKYISRARVYLPKTRQLVSRGYSNGTGDVRFYQARARAMRAECPRGTARYISLRARARTGHILAKAAVRSLFSRVRAYLSGAGGRGL